MYVLPQSGRGPAMSEHLTGMAYTPRQTMQLEEPIKKESVKDPYVEGNVKLVDIIDCGSEVMCVRFNPEGTYVAIGLANGVVKVVNLETMKLHFTLVDNSDVKVATLPVTSLKFCPAAEDAKIEQKHLLMASYASGMIRFWHYTSGTCVQTINEQRQTLATAFSPPGTTFLTAGTDPQLRLYDTETRKLLRVLEPSDAHDLMNGHRARIFSVQYHQHEPHGFISGGWDDTVQFWDDRSRHSTRKLYGPHICGDALDIDPVHNHIVSGSWRKDKVLQIWDYGSGEKIKDVPHDHLHGSLLYCAQWLGKEHIICGGCERNMVRIIDRGTLNTVGQLVELPRGVFCIDHDRSSLKPHIAVGSATKIFMLKLEGRK